MGTSAQGPFFQIKVLGFLSQEKKVNQYLRSAKVTAIPSEVY